MLLEILAVNRLFKQYFDSSTSDTFIHSFYSSLVLYDFAFFINVITI
jgi:hypothetical protein